MVGLQAPSMLYYQEFRQAAMVYYGTSAPKVLGEQQEHLELLVVRAQLEPQELLVAMEPLELRE